MTDGNLPPEPWCWVGEPIPPKETQVNKVLENAKAICALVGAICTALLGVYAADTPVGQVLTVVSVVATAVVTWSVPNASAERAIP